MDKTLIQKTDHNEPEPKVIALQASAGSGKTHNLSIQFIKTILQGCNKQSNISSCLNKILAITFTNKAANEMKERIIKHLKLIALPDLKAKDEERESIIQQLAFDNNNDLPDIADTLIQDIFKNYSDFQIRTIDSFLRSIIVASLRETELRPDFEIVMDPLPYIEYAVDELLSKIHTDDAIKKDFLKFLEIYLNVENKTGFYIRDSIVDTINNLRSLKNRSGKDIYCSPNNSKEVDLKKEAFKNALEQFYKLMNNLKVRKHNRNFPENLLDKIKNNDFISSLWTKPDVEYILVKESKHFKDKLQPHWTGIRNLLAELLTEISDTYYNSYCDLLNKVESIINNVTYTAGEVLVDDINTHVRRLIEKYEVPELYFNLGERILYYLIDEFQDTDRAQWSNIKDLIVNSLANNGSFFYVGDKKQSIYRFKGGDPTLFDEVRKDTEILPYGVKVTNLTDNRRSGAELIEFFNETFEPERLKSILQPADDELNSIINNKIVELIDSTYRDSSLVCKNERVRGYVRVEFIRQKKVPEDDGGKQQDNNEQNIEEDLNVKLDKVIKELREKGFAFSDIAILVRKNDEIKNLSIALKQMGIPVQSILGFDIREHPLIIEVVSFLQFLNNPIDNLSFVTFITGEIFGKISGIQSADTHKWLLEHAGKGYLYVEFRKWQQQLWNEFIKPLLNEVGYLPAYDITSEIIERFRINEYFPESAGFFAHLLEILKTREDDGENNLDGFIEYWKNCDREDDKFFVRLSSANAVKILTIHKAKGLEFPAVILPSASIETKSKNMLTLERNEQDGRLSFVYAKKQYLTILHSINQEDPYVKAYVKEQSLSFIDELNTFYVAVTRAKQALYIFINNEKDPIYNLFKDKLDENRLYIKGELIQEKKEAVGESFLKSKSQPSAKWQQHIFIKLPDRDSLEHYKEERRGEIIHKILSNITRVDEHIRDRILEQVDIMDKEFITDKFIDNLIEVINSEEGRPWFNPSSDIEVFTEKDIVDKRGQIKRIDRLVLTRDEAIVIDYKTGGMDELDKHKKQVREYMSTISELYPLKRTKGYLVYIDHKKIEEVR
ncbi:MAG: UvrD-helicase domain-containing protein [bacterium]